jgi:hypothetical protein
MLDLKERNFKSNNSTLNRATLETWKAASRRAHPAMINEFGDTELIDSI